MHWLATTPDQTEALGAALARAVAAASGSSARAIYLRGELGAGKTTLARSFIHALGIDERVRSPSYAVLEIYPAGAIDVVHLDCYRLQSPEEAASLGLREHDRPGTVWLIEWPERAAGFLPDADLEVTMEIRADGHAIELTASTDAGHRWLERLEPIGIATAWS